MRVRRRLALLEARQRGFEHGIVNRPESYHRDPDAELDRAYRDGRESGAEAAKAVEVRTIRQLGGKIGRSVRDAARRVGA